MKERRYPYYRIYVDNYIIYYVVIADEGAENIISLCVFIRKEKGEELLAATRENREPLIIPDFSCHHLRHTFCTRLCETETNLKVIQSIMGHASIQIIMGIYAEATDRQKKNTIENLSLKFDIF